MYQTHFIYDTDNCTVLGRKGEKVSYKEDVMGTQAMTVVLCLTGGKHSKLLDPFFIFQNEKGKYPIRGVPDNVDGCF